MSANHVAAPERSAVSNLDRATTAWGADMPEWVRMLVTAADRTSQRVVSDRLGKSSGYVSRLINRNYAGDYGEAETQVRAIFGAETVQCPAFDRIPLQSCIRLRRRKTPPTNLTHRTAAAHCPGCPINTDREED